MLNLPFQVDWELLEQQREWLAEQAREHKEAEGLLHLVEALFDIYNPSNLS